MRVLHIATTACIKLLQSVSRQRCLVCACTCACRAHRKCSCQIDSAFSNHILQSGLTADFRCSYICLDSKQASALQFYTSAYAPLARSPRSSAHCPGVTQSPRLRLCSLALVGGRNAVCRCAIHVCVRVNGGVHRTTIPARAQHYAYGLDNEFRHVQESVRQHHQSPVVCGDSGRATDLASCAGGGHGD